MIDETMTLDEKEDRRPFSYALIGVQHHGSNSDPLRYAHLAQIRRRIHAFEFARSSSGPADAAVLRCSEEVAQQVCDLLNKDLPPIVH